MAVAVAPAAVRCVRGAGAEGGREVAGVSGQPGTVAGPLPSPQSPHHLVCPTCPQTSMGQGAWCVLPTRRFGDVAHKVRQ